MLNFLRTIIPKPLLSLYHLALAKLAALWYGFPSEKLVVIGVTGTKGKSTTVYMIARVLEAAGHKTGYTSTIGFKVAGREWLNDQKMTMLGRFVLQKLLRQMADEGCEFAVIETSSEGLAQHRHAGIWYDAAVFTGLTPEHLEAHGGFENYKKAKLRLFSHLERLPRKGKNRKIIVANADSQHAKDFLNFMADKKVGYSDADASGLSLKLPGRFNQANAAAALAVAKAFGLDQKAAAAALENISVVPGRMEQIENDRGLTIVVDYAHEPESIKQAYEAARSWKYGRLIHLLGPTGGGRDRWRRPVMGEMAARHADFVIITTDDPYDDDPEAILEEMAQGAKKAGKIWNKNLFVITDRREAIRKALHLAQKGDLVLLTGKGAEQVMAVAGGKKIKWDDRQVAREELATLVASPQPFPRSEREKG